MQSEGHKIHVSQKALVCCDITMHHVLRKGMLHSIMLHFTWSGMGQIQHTSTCTSHKHVVTGFVNLLWDNTTQFEIWLVTKSALLLNKTPLVQPQPAGLSWAAQRRRPHVHSSSRSSVVETSRTWTWPLTSVYPRAQPRSCAFNPTSRSVLRDTFRSYVT